MTIQEAVEYGEEMLRDHGLGEPRWNAERILMSALRLSRAHLYSRPDRELSPDEFEGYRKLLHRRALHYPLAYLEGVQEFFGREFAVTEDVLIPRPETEEIIRAVLNLPLPEHARLLDLGAGSGNIPVTLALEIPKAHVFAVEISMAAIHVLRRNAGGKLCMICADFNHLPFLPESFDGITANPPYVEQGQHAELPVETRWEPPLALMTPEIEPVYGAILRESARVLRKGGYLVFEIGYGQKERILDLCSRHQEWEIVGIYPDFRSIPRVFCLRRSK